MNEERGARAAGPRVDGEPESLAERLEQRFGKRVDPSITLDAGATPPERAPSSQHAAAGGAHDGTPSDETPGSGELAPELMELAVFDPKRRRYVPRGEIGRGGMGAVIEVWDRHLRRTLAMKVALEAHSEEGESGTIDSKRVSRFLEEAQITSQLDHPGIVPVHEIGMDPSGRVYFTMRRIAGRDLKAIFDLACTSCENWTMERALGVLVKVSETLAYAHSKGVIHRDLKPANIMIGAFGEVYVMDWGLAKVQAHAAAPAAKATATATAGELGSASEESLEGAWVESDRAQLLRADPDSDLATLEGEIVGTPCYMAPEQALRDQLRVGPRSDIYSIGCLLYQLLTLRRPYVPDEGKTNAWEVLQALRKGPPTCVQKLNPRAPAELVAICEKAMARDPERRYADFSEMAEDLRAYLEGRVVKAHAVGPLAEFKKWVGRNRAVAGASATAFALLVGGVFFFAWEQQSHAHLVEAKHVEAQRARERAERSEDDARRQSYAATIAAAASALRGAEVREATRRLGETPADMRGWEWHHLALQADGSMRRGDVEGGARVVAHHPSQAYFAVGTTRGEIQLFDAEQGVLVRSFPAHESAAITALSWSKDGKRLASGASDGGLRIFALDGGAPLLLAGHANAVTALDYAPSGDRLLSAGADLELVVWDAASGERVSRTRSAQGAFSAAIFGRGIGDPIFAAAEEKLFAWYPEPERVSVLQSYASPITALAASSEGEIAIGLRSGSIVRFTRVRGFALEGHTDRVHALEYSADGKWLASASADRTLRIWNAKSGDRTPRTLIGHVEAVTAVDFAPAGDLLLSGSEDGTWRLWSLDSCEAHTRTAGHEKAVHALAFAPDGASLLSASLDGSAALWDPSTGALRIRVRSSDDALTSAVFAGRSDSLATAATDGTIRIWDARRAENTNVLHGHLSGVQSLATSPDGSTLASGSWDGTVRLWNLADGTERTRFTEHREPVTCVAFHPQGRWLASSDRGGRILVRDLATGRVERELLGHEGWVGSIAFHPQLPWLASGGSDETVRLWDASTGETLAVLLGHDAAVHAVAFDGDGSRLASGSADRTVRLWSTSARASLVALRGHAEAVNAVVFSPDGTQLASASADGGVHIFETRQPAVRHAAHRAAAALRTAALPRVDRLFAQHPFACEVIDALRADSALSEAERGAAMGLAFERALSPRELNRRSWTIVRQPGQQAQDYERALQTARAAVRAAADDPQVLSTLGAAHFRNNDPTRAVLFLRQADRLNRARTSSGSPADLAFLALSLWQLGQRDEARAQLARLEELMKEPAQRSDEEALDLLEQVRSALR